MLNIGIIGCGNWSFKILKEIEVNKNFHITSIACRNYKSKNLDFKNKINIYQSMEELFEENINDCVYVAGTPKLNLNVTKLAKINRTPLILEKPISNSYKNAKEIQNIANNNKMIILPNLSNYFSESFFYLKNFIEENFNQIQNIIIYEGGYGPFRKKIHPIWDWGFHSFSTLTKLFENNNFSKIINKEIKMNNIYGKGIITKFKFNIDSKFEVKILTGNLFKNKIRKIKVILKNHNVLENNLVDHKIYLNKKIIFTNSNSPLQTLLNNFNQVIVSKNRNLSQSLIKASCKTTKILEEFYNC